MKKSRYMLIISLFIIAGFMVTSFASYFVSLSSLRAGIAENELPLTSDNIYSEIQRDLFQPVFISSLMASDTFLRDWVIQGEEDQREVIRYLNEIKSKYNTFTSFFVSEHSKKYYYPEGILKEVKPGRQRDKWYFRVRDMKEDHEINVDPDMANNDTMTIFVNYRVYDYNRNYIGAAGVGLKVDAVKNLIGKYQENYGSKIYFVDEKGNVVLYGSNFDKDVKNINDIGGISSISGDILGSDVRSFSYKKEGKVVLLNTRYIPEFKWHLIVERGEGAVAKKIQEALYINLIICGIVTLIVLLMLNFIIAPYEKKLQEMAVTDKLTGVNNRQAFDIIMEQTLKDTERNNQVFSVILFDIDNFKKINDMFGHLTGDKILKNIVSVVSTTLRKSDVFSRWGGDEFIIILKYCGIEESFDVAEKIRLAVEENKGSYIGKETPVTISLGVTEYCPSENIDSVIGRADAALLSAKSKGRNRSEKGSVNKSIETV